MAEFADTTNQKAQIGIRSKAQTTQVMTAIMWCIHSIVYHCQTVSDAIEIHQHVFQRSVAHCAKDERLPALNDSSALPFMGAIFCNEILALPSMGGMVSWCPVGLGKTTGEQLRQPALGQLALREQEEELARLIQELEVGDEGSQTEQVLAEQPRQPDWVYRPASLQDWRARPSTQERKCR